MAAANGMLTPSDAIVSASQSPSGLKRKRSESASAKSNGDLTNSKPTASLLNRADFVSLQKAVLGILESYDTKPSLLEQPIKRSPSSQSSQENPAKRTKTSDDGALTSIKEKLQNGFYSSFEPLLADVDISGTHLLSTYKTGSDNVSTYKPPSLAETRLTTGISALKKVLKNQVLREVTQHTLKLEPNGTNEEVGEENTKGDAVQPPEEVSAGADSRVASGKKVLTIFANAQGPKTLFSSLQQPAHVETSSENNSTCLSTSIDVTLPMNDSTGLPGMIRITESIPTQSTSKRTPTIGELFAPPASVPQLSPPKPAKPLTTKGSVVTWVAKDSVTRSNRKGKTYFSQPLATGQWLGYGGVDSSIEPTSPEAKAKHRQRALSTGAARPPMHAAAIAALQQAKDDALFRSAYSSFAPSHDDAIAIVPSEIRNKVWWHKVGSKAVGDEPPVDPALLGEAIDDDDMEDATVVDNEAEEKSFKAAVESYEPDDLEAALGLKSKEDKEVNSILKEISELIETLHSYQRIRNSTLAGNLRTPVTSSAPVLNGTPSSPSAAEIDIYKILKSQLSLLISTLPPYAVAKLNGEQLSDLNISRNIVVETKTYEGILEEDQVSRLAKVTSLSAAPSKSVVAPGHPTAYSSYGRGPPATPHGPPSSRPASTYYPQQQPPNRTPSIAYTQRPPAATPSYPNAYPQAHRPSYAPTPSYTQPTPRGGYQQMYYQGQRPPPGYQVQATTYYNTPAGNQAPQRPAYTPQPHSYNPRPPPATQMYAHSPAAPSPHMRTASPLKPALTTGPGYAQSPPRPGSYTPGPARPGSASVYAPQQTTQGEGAGDRLSSLANGGQESRAGSGTPGAERESGTPMSM